MVHNLRIALSRVFISLEAGMNTLLKAIVVIGESLSFKTRIIVLIKKLFRVIGVLPKVKLFLNKSSLLSLYCSILISICNTQYWPGLQQTNLIVIK